MQRTGRHASSDLIETMPVAASAIYFLNLRGDVLINRLYRDDVGSDLIETMPVAASAIYFLNLRGDVLINRLYRNDVGHMLLENLHQSQIAD
uniref:AP-2 complex subunit mu n=1 Tax=Tanacetum cinerariifolium TaxID=118510 RepID=A0A6L2M200_TANCI|nr:AP-2 complex subunit mu [Tanacetum cinerariifolium]